MELLAVRQIQRAPRVEAQCFNLAKTEILNVLEHFKTSVLFM